jgi:hypothetical protein
MSLDEVAISLRGFSYRQGTGGYGSPDPPAMSLKAPSGLEPEEREIRGAERKRGPSKGDTHA